MWKSAGGRAGIALAGMLCLVVHAPASGGGVAVVRTILEDNGDQDGYADTQETVTLRLVLRNTSGQDLSDLGARLSTEDGALACLTRSAILLGDLAAGEERTTSDGFEFVVSPDVERTSVDESLSVRFLLDIHTPGRSGLNTLPWIDLDLDLDVSGGGAPTTFFESFESGFGQFTTMHLDEPLNPPESDLANRPVGVANSDGWRCPYSDPAWAGSASYGNSQGAQCFPTANGLPDTFYFDVVTDRAFSGAAAMGFAIDLGPGLGYTSPAGQLEAIRTIDPVNLAHGRVCSVTRTVSCANDAACPPDETCEDAAPALSFKHQISLMDHRSVATQPERGPERAIVGAQLAGADGAPSGTWDKLYPFVNVYDTQANSNFISCSFDPIDDGNTEEDFFDPTDPNRYQGPSSTCAPEFSFAHQGDTDDPYSAANVGSGEPDSGLAGDHGIGTWVEPRFDLSRYRGRRIRLRFLETGTKYGGIVNWEQVFQFNPDPGDDGWFIDDVTVTDAILDPPATVVPDTKDNSGLPFDLGDDTDLDGVFDVCDTCPDLANADQTDLDGDGLGNACDACPDDPLNDVDGDGHCAPVDNCPDTANADQGDVDRDRVGDLCDTCPLILNTSQGVDEDRDGVGCAVDNCPAVENADQADLDGDGIGDACDGCPSDPAGDGDEDGLCALDACPFYPSSVQGIAVGLAPVNGSVWLTPDEQELVGRFPWLGRMPLTGGVPQFLYTSSSVSQHALTPDGAAVVFEARADQAMRLFRVSLAGGAPLRLDTTGPDDEVVEFEIASDGSRVLYVESIDSAGRELRSVPIGGGAPALLSPSWAPGDRTGIHRLIGPDGTRVLVWRGGPDLFVAPLEGGALTELSAGLAVVNIQSDARFTPDGTRVMFRASAVSNGPSELYQVPVDGSVLPSKVLPAEPQPTVGAFHVSPDGGWVVFEGREDGSGPWQLFRAPALGGPPVRLNSPLADSQSVSDSFLDPTGTHVAYRLYPASELFLVPVNGGEAVPVGTARYSTDYVFSPDGTWLVYRTIERKLFSISIAGGAAVSLSPAGVVVDSFRITDDGSSVAYVTAITPQTIFLVPIAGGDGEEPPLNLSDGLRSSSSAPGGILAQTGDGSVFFWNSSGTLHGTWLEADPDQDGIHRVCDCDEDWQGAVEINDGLDNQCPGTAGSGLIDELPAGSGFTDPHDATRFAWSPLSGTTRYEVVRASDPAFTADCACASVQNVSVAISESPASEGVFFYLARAAAPHRGSAGADSAGKDRAGACLTIPCD